MPQNFLTCDRDQELLMPPSVRDWLAEDHLAWFVLDALEQVDLAGVYGTYRADGHGRAAHDPGMMVALLVYAYAVGERSSRQIERRCMEDVAFRVIAANRQPDHTTIARFRARHEQALADLFVSVLELCAKAGMVKVGTVAVDGTKMHANAGLSANRELPAIRKEIEEILGEAAEVDAAEDALFGDARGDELPPELADRASRRARLERAKRELEAEAQAREDEYRAVIAAREEHRKRTGSNPRGRPPKPPQERWDVRGKKSKRNLTDPDSRIMSLRGALVQGYNAQALVGEGRVILAAEVTNSAIDNNQLADMVAAARENLEAVGHDGKIKCVLADGGYWNQQDIRTVRETQTTVIVPTKDPHRDGERKRKPHQGPEADRINKILSTNAGRRLYRKRAAMVEPVFAHTKHTRGIDRFARRGREHVANEWKLIAATHNLLKLFRYQPQTA
jgi:transposase